MHEVYAATLLAAKREANWQRRRSFLLFLQTNGYRPVAPILKALPGHRAPSSAQAAAAAAFSAAAASAAASAAAFFAAAVSAAASTAAAISLAAAANLNAKPAPRLPLMPPPPPSMLGPSTEPGPVPAPVATASSLEEQRELLRVCVFSPVGLAETIASFL